MSIFKHLSTIKRYNLRNSTTKHIYCKPQSHLCSDTITSFAQNTFNPWIQLSSSKSILVCARGCVKYEDFSSYEDHCLLNIVYFLNTAKVKFNIMG